MDKAQFKTFAHAGLADMDALLKCEGDLTPEQRQQYKAAAIRVLDAARDHLLSPECDKSPAVKQELLADGQRLRDLLAKLP